MNRAEKRRQQKLLKKRTAQRKASHPTGDRPYPQSQAVAQMINQAVKHHSAKQFTEAQALYQRVLDEDPNHPDALHLLGMLAHNAGDNDRAVALISKALVNIPSHAQAHFNLGNAYSGLGQHEQAVASFQKAIALKPDYVEAYNNLGRAFKQLLRLEDAIVAYRKAIAINPGFSGVYNNLGNCLIELGRWEDVIAVCEQVLTFQPDSVLTHIQIGNALQNMSRFEEAVTRYQQAIALDPKNAAAHGNLGATYRHLGKPLEAFDCLHRSVALDPDMGLFWVNLALAAGDISFSSADDSLIEIFSQMLEHRLVSPLTVVLPILSVLRCQPDFQKALELGGLPEAEMSFPFSDYADQLSNNRLFCQILKLTPIPGRQVERMLTFLRRVLINEVINGRIEDNGLPFIAALALQCFINEYVYFETPEEGLAVDRIAIQIAGMLEADEAIPAILVAALSSYRPLHTYTWARKLAERDEVNPICEIIDRQIREPLDEQSLRDQITRLTPLEDTVSKQVGAQYEENPYPRWIKAPTGDEPRDIPTILRSAPLFFDIGDYQPPARPQVLVAGCGTGIHPISTASRFKYVDVLAVDLSLSSLAYATRKTRELGITNITYAQADIMELQNLDKKFDLIESVGVLHHLEDPVAGWRNLVALLQPGGFMRIGLYSEAARANVVAGRALISKLGGEATKDIRGFRQKIIAEAEAGDDLLESICSSSDFFSISNCRDLLFHVQEHRFDFLQIDAALKALDLRFLGLEVKDPGIMNNFSEMFPVVSARTSLVHWHEFEQKNPQAFAGMYQFYCRKN